jgi:hypothetical protein
MATVDPSELRETEYPEKSAADSPSVSAPNWTQSARDSKLPNRNAKENKTAKNLRYTISFPKSF